MNEKQVGGTTIAETRQTDRRPFLAMNEACDLERVFTVKFHSKEAVQLFV